MSIAAAVVTRLEAASGVTNLVGSGDDARIYPPGQVPQSPTKPFLRYQVISDVPEVAMGVNAGVAHERMQIDSFADGYDAARSLATEVYAALNRFSGTSAGVVIQGVICLNKGRDLYEEDVEENRVIQDYMIHYEE